MSILLSRRQGMEVIWVLHDTSPFLDSQQHLAYACMFADCSCTDMSKLGRHEQTDGQTANDNHMHMSTPRVVHLRLESYRHCQH